LVAVPFETLSTKPVALAPVWATVKIGVHIYPFLATKRGGITPTLGERTPLKKQKSGVTPAFLRGWFCLGYSVLFG